MFKGKGPLIGICHLSFKVAAGVRKICLKGFFCFIILFKCNINSWNFSTILFALQCLYYKLFQAFIFVDDLSGDDESDAAISRQSRKWRRRSSDSQKVGLKLAKAGEPANDESPPEALSFVTFKDGRHKLADENDGQDFV